MNAAAYAAAGITHIRLEGYEREGAGGSLPLPSLPEVR